MCVLMVSLFVHGYVVLPDLDILAIEILGRAVGLASNQNSEICACNATLRLVPVSTADPTAAMALPMTGWYSREAQKKRTPRLDLLGFESAVDEQTPESASF